MAMTKTYHGSCRCGQVRFEADIDLDQGTTKCNCTYCWKLRWWGTIVKPSAFRLISGQEATGYAFPAKNDGTRALCKQCGVISFGWGHLEQAGGDYVSLSVSSLDDLDPADLVRAPVQYLDGRHDSWWEVPAETRHL